jgi:hypothetical protein
MCFFDNFGTANRPNVYIEVGIAYALGVPMIVAEYAGGGLESVAESVPSDLQGLFRIRYATYESFAESSTSVCPRSSHATRCARENAHGELAAPS